MTNRSAALVTVAVAVGAIGINLGAKPAPRFVWNASESVPTGLYQVQPTHHLIVTMLVVAYPPDPLASFLADRGYLPRGVPLIKRVLALSGQTAPARSLQSTGSKWAPRASTTAADVCSRPGTVVVSSVAARSS